MKTLNINRQVAVVIAVIAVVFSAAAQTEEYRGYKIGRYEGDITNKTYSVNGTAAFEIRRINRVTGDVTAYLAPTSSNLSGEGVLTGRIDESGILRVSGQFGSWTARVVARISGETIKANYSLEGGSTQEGVFQATRTSADSKTDDIPVPDADQPQARRSNQNQPVRGGETAECSFETPAPKSLNSDPFSLKLAKREIYDNYNLSANGTLSAPLRVGVSFLTFTAGKAYKNTVRVDPGRGALRINDAAPPNVMIYRVKSIHIIFEEYRNSVSRRKVEAEYDCFKNRSGEWTCGSSGMFPKITQLP